MKTWLAASLLTMASISISAQETKPAMSNPSMVMPAEYKAKDFSRLLGKTGLNDELLKMHFKLYEGYVKNVNLLIKSFQEYSMETPLDIYTFGALKRRFGWEFDGMRLHEYYFENLGGKTPLPEDSDLYRAIAAQFGSYDDWRKQFGDIAMIRGIGYVILYRDPLSGRLMNVWINEHDLGHLAGGEPLLVLDVWEHAYLTQFGLDRAGYVDTFFKNVDWNAVQKRFSSSKM